MGKVYIYSRALHCKWLQSPSIIFLIPDIITSLPARAFSCAHSSILTHPVTRLWKPAKQVPAHLSPPVHPTQPDGGVCWDIREAEPDHKDVWKHCLPPVEDSGEVFQEAESLRLTDSCAHYSHITCSLVFIITDHRIAMSHTCLEPSLIKFKAGTLYNSCRGFRYIRPI